MPAAIKTPYLPNGKFDLEAYDAMVELQIQVGAARHSSPGPAAGKCCGLHLCTAAGAPVLRHPAPCTPPLPIQNGVEGLIIGGTTGEGQLMSWDEHIMLIAHTGASCARRTAGRLATGAREPGWRLRWEPCGVPCAAAGHGFCTP